MTPHLEDGADLPSAYRLYTAALILLLSTGAAAAQDHMCGAIVNAALEALAEHCAALERNSVCAGNPAVDITLAPGFAGFDSASPGDRADLLGVSKIATGELDTEEASWGAAIMHLGAHLPATYAGPGAIIMLAGAAEIINEIQPEQALRIGEPLSTVALMDTTRYKLPGVIPEPVGGLSADELLLVDAWDNTGDWLRVVTGGSTSWAESDKLARLKAMDALPRLGLGSAFAMQSVALSTGTSYPVCAEAEPMVAIQTPADLPTSLSVNGIDIHIGSMVTFQQFHRNALSLTVHRGEVTTIFGQRARQGESIVGILGETPAGDRAVLDWSGVLPASEAEIARGERAQAALNRVAQVNGWEEFQTFSNPPELIHVVQYGDSLFSLARRYETSVAGIIAANQRSETLRLFSGMEIVIPNPGSGFSGRSQPRAGTPAASDNTPDCASLRLTSPLEAAYGSPTTYYWDGLARATGYQVNYYDHSTNAQVGSFSTSGSVTRLEVAVGQLGVGGHFRWEVIALVGSQAVCSAASQPLAHLSA